MLLTFQERFDEVRQELVARHEAVHVVLAPPRTSSTALVRVFWRHPAIGHYNNEPFDRRYYRAAPLDSVLDHLLNSAIAVPDGVGGRHLLIKEMTFQAGTEFRLLAEVATGPLVFVLRDPRACIESRIRMESEGNGDPQFPLDRTGWVSAREQVMACRDEGRPYLLVAADDFRRRPKPVLGLLFERLGLTFSTDQLSWRPVDRVRMGNLDGVQDNFYARVMASSGIEAPYDEIPDLASFPTDRGLRDHVAHAVEIYKELLADPARVGGEGGPVAC